MPYSCQAQFGRSGCSGCPYGGGSTVRGMLRSIDHSSTLTIVHTAMRASFGSLSGGRSTMAEYGTRSFGSFIRTHGTGRPAPRPARVRFLPALALATHCAGASFLSNTFAIGSSGPQKLTLTVPAHPMSSKEGDRDRALHLAMDAHGWER